jgi:hypothetical protein
VAGYCIDTSPVISGRNDWYPPESFRSLWDAVEALIVAGDLLMPKEVLEELERGDDECVTWARSFPDFVADADDAVTGRVAGISSDVPGWVQQERNYADPFVVAHACEKNLVVITQERPALATEDHNMRIPQVSSRYGVDCVTFGQLISREGWTF